MTTTADSSANEDGPASANSASEASSENPTARVLRRSKDDRVIGGVCSGLGRYFGMDPILMRLLFVIFALAGGSAFLAYIVLWIVVPEERDGDNVASGSTLTLDLNLTRGWQALGFVLVLIGLATFTQQIVPGIDYLIWPIMLVAAGIALVFHGASKQ